MKKIKKRICCDYQMLQIHYHVNLSTPGHEGKTFTERVGVICRECFKTILDPICNLVIERNKNEEN